MLPKFKNMSLHEKKGLWGWVFIAPWIIGFTLLFAVPLIQSIIYSFSELSLTTTGMHLGFLGMSNYVDALTKNVDFNRTLIEVMVAMIANFPSIVLFSFFIAVVLKQKIRGRIIPTALFSLSGILASAVIVSMESGNFSQYVMSDYVGS